MTEMIYGRNANCRFEQGSDDVYTVLETNRRGVNVAVRYRIKLATSTPVGIRRAVADAIADEIGADYVPTSAPDPADDH